MRGEEGNEFDVGSVGFLYEPVGDGNGIPLTIVGHAIVLWVPKCCCSLGILSI